MTLRASMNPSWGRGNFPGPCGNLEPGKRTPAHGYEVAPVGLLASPDRPKVCATALTSVRAWM
jgi:hypothetical protein